MDVSFGVVARTTSSAPPLVRSLLTRRRRGLNGAQYRRWKAGNPEAERFPAVEWLLLTGQGHEKHKCCNSKHLRNYSSGVR
jgi:hypothetical protein